MPLSSGKRICYGVLANACMTGAPTREMNLSWAGVIADLLVALIQECHADDSPQCSLLGFRGDVVREHSRR